jgi:hypothetical protein
LRMANTQMHDRHVKVRILCFLQKSTFFGTVLQLTFMSLYSQA